MSLLLQVISAFLSQGDKMEEDLLAGSAPQANAYEFQSGGIVDMLEKLKDKFEDERTDLEKEESNARHAYEMLIQVFAGTLCFTIWSPELLSGSY